MSFTTMSSEATASFVVVAWGAAMGSRNSTELSPWLARDAQPQTAKANSGATTWRNLGTRSGRKFGASLEHLFISGQNAWRYHEQPSFGRVLESVGVGPYQSSTMIYAQVDRCLVS